MFFPFGFSAYDTNQFDRPPVVLENLFAEEAQDKPNRQARLMPTPGLIRFDVPNADNASSADISGSASAMFQSDGVISGDIIVIAGANVYKVNSSGIVTAISGTVSTSGTLCAQMVASQTPELVAVAGGTAYTISSSNVTSFTWANLSGSVTSVDVIGQRHLYTESGSGRLHISDAADATTVTEFVTAEGDPDGLKAVKVSGASIYLFGSETTEVAYLTGDTLTPVAFRTGSALDYGIKSSRAVCNTDDGLAFVAHTNQIYLLQGGRLQAIGTPPIIREIEALQSVTARDGIEMYYYAQSGHKFVVLHIPGYGDMFFDMVTGLWHRRRRLTEVNSGIGPIVRAFGFDYCLDNRATGDTRVHRIRSDRYTNNGEAVRRVATALVPIEDNEVRIKSVHIEGQAGTGLPAGQGSDPQLFFKIALDGQSFGKEISRSMGKAGEYRKRIKYGPLGIARPGVIAAQIAWSDPVPFTVTGGIANAEVLR